MIDLNADGGGDDDDRPTPEQFSDEEMRREYEQFCADMGSPPEIGGQSEAELYSDLCDAVYRGFQTVEKEAAMENDGLKHTSDVPRRTANRIMAVLERWNLIRFGGDNWQGGDC